MAEKLIDVIVKFSMHLKMGITMKAKHAMVKNKKKQLPEVYWLRLDVWYAGYSTNIFKSNRWNLKQMFIHNSGEESGT